MKVAVTGATGFLGTNLINQLVDRGHEITAIDRVRSDKELRINYMDIIRAGGCSSIRRGSRVGLGAARPPARR
jgi:nucleoside-diphosphate-sugar epimerase